MSSGSEFLCRRCCRYRLHLLVTRGALLRLRHSRHLLHLHVSSGALLRLRRSRDILLHLRVVSDNNCEIFQFATVYVDQREPYSRLLHDICLFLGVLSLM